MSTTYEYTTTNIKADQPAQPSKRFSLLRNKNGSRDSGTKASTKLHLELRNSMDKAKRAFKKAASLTPGHEQRVTRRENIRDALIDTMVLKSTLRDEKKKLRASEKVAEDVKAELESVKQARQTLQADLEQEKNLATIQEEKLNELKIQNTVHGLRLELETKSSAAWKAEDSKQIKELKQTNEQINTDFEVKLEQKKVEITELQCELFELHQQVEVVGSKLEAAELQAAEKIEALENTIKQVELSAEQHLTSEKDKFERENSSLAWELHQAQKSFGSERAHVNGLHDELAFVEAENLNFESDNIRLRAERDDLHTKLASVSNELQDVKKAVSYAIERMYLDNPLVKKDPETTSLSDALQDHVEINKKKIEAARIYQARAEKEVADEKTKYRQLADKTAEQRQEWLAMKKEIGDCKGARKQAEYDLVQQGHKFEAVNSRNQELETELEEVKQTSQAAKEKGEQLEKHLAEAKQKNEQLEMKLTEAKKMAENSTQKKVDGRDDDAEAKIAELTQRCAQLKQEKIDLQDEQETEECIAAEKISNLERELAGAKAQLQEHGDALKNANSWLQEMDEIKKHQHEKVLDSITRANRAIQLQTLAEKAYDEVSEEKKLLERQIDGEQASFEAEISQLKQTFGGMREDLRSALEGVEDGLMSGEMNNIHEAVVDMRDILGSREIVDESLEESGIEQQEAGSEQAEAFNDEEGEYHGHDLSTIEEETEEEVAAQEEEVEEELEPAVAGENAHEDFDVAAVDEDQEEIVLDEIEQLDALGFWILA
ncbi:uncharacterized protein MYCFIDRAFT_195859 [Pseudocercospora fijiensis CIRAD86]|uniref:Uncharacterized protein n=1 Tax=Pseudocercospora fijiensis (strain CIRAD86) TaxID=383855 RepID=M3AK45_PSEFD|nr:uncharacterized protein MYCFIDRAFT_195859 [Pseudocercospora fijiensis CIRAD86]EME84951.1 hypothetical protein MYCFIDRAFT_195859 [Pseudocercospora fijiensis CIRAD86]